jgi:hypothetical protein
LGPQDWRVVIEADPLRLVPATRADTADMLVLLDDRSLHRHTGGEPRDTAALEAYYQRLERGPALHAAERRQRGDRVGVVTKSSAVC